LLNDHSIEPVEVKHSNGKVVLITGSVYLEGKRPQGILIAQDITKLKQLETTRQQFVANVSHELKTPITYIRSLIETILNAKEKNIDLDINFIEKALGHTDRLNNIINDLLQLSKLEFGEVDKESLNIAAAIDAAIQENQPRADKKNIVLVYKGADIDVPYNYSLMIQAIKNLIENAIKFSSEETKVVIDCKASDFAVDIEVSDFGQGIPAEHIPNLFQRFYRVDTARSRQLGGTGLGLSIVKHIAQSHGGEAFVTSEIDKGSTFTIRLPLN
jgi:two-component system phosphate regulon sensor histidine kinase PhoR